MYMYMYVCIYSVCIGVLSKHTLRKFKRPRLGLILNTLFTCMLLTIKS